MKGNYFMKLKSLFIALSVLFVSSCNININSWSKHYATEWSYNEDYHWHQCTDPEYYTESKDKAVHDYEKTVVAPTYAEEGYTKYECKICGYGYIGDKVEKIPFEVIIENPDGSSVDYYNSKWHNIYNKDFKTHLIEATAKVSQYIIEDGKVRDFIGWTPTDTIIKGQTIFKPIYGEPQDYSIKYGYKYNWSNGSVVYYVDGIDNVLNKESLDVVIPESRYMGDIAWIANSAFEGNTVIKSIKLSKNISSIGNYAFNKCSNLESITFTDNLETIGNKAFMYCTSLKEIEIPDSVESIGTNCFQNCESLINIKLPANLKEIDSAVFANCYSLEKIEIPDSVQTFGMQAFSGCKSLKYVKTPLNLGYIAYKCFENCTNLKSLYLPYDMTQFGTFVFIGTTDLTLYTAREKKGSYWQTAWDSGATNLKVVFNCTDREKYNPYYGD